MMNTYRYSVQQLLLHSVVPNRRTRLDLTRTPTERCHDHTIKLHRINFRHSDIDYSTCIIYDKMNQTERHPPSLAVQYYDDSRDSMHQWIQYIAIMNPTHNPADCRCLSALFLFDFCEPNKYNRRSTINTTHYHYIIVWWYKNRAREKNPTKNQQNGRQRGRDDDKSALPRDGIKTTVGKSSVARGPGVSPVSLRANAAPKRMQQSIIVGA